MTRNLRLPVPLVGPERLALLAAQPDPVAGAIALSGAEQGWWDAGQAWLRTFDRHDPGCAPYATFLYETREPPQRLCVVEVFARAPRRRAPHAVQRAEPGLGYLRLTPFPWDPRLTTLGALLAELAQHGHVLRYRPHKRCTLRVVDASGRSAFCKVFGDDRGRVIDREGVGLWRAATRGALDFDVAEPYGWDAAHRTVWQSTVAGEPVIDRLLAADGASLAQRMGRACASLGDCGLRPALRFDGPAQMQRTARYAAELGERLPELRAEIPALLARLGSLHEAAARRALRPIHGAPHAHQWLDSGARLGLVDFDRFCMGDPELDAATFLAEMDFEDAGGASAASIGAAFVDGYQSVAGTLRTGLLHAYRAHKHLAKCLKAARRTRPDAGRRALRKFRSLQRMLREERA